MPRASSRSAWACVGPEGVEPGVFELDEALAGLEELGQVGLVGVEEPFHAGDLRERAVSPAVWSTQVGRLRSTWRRRPDLETARCSTCWTDHERR